MKTFDFRCHQIAFLGQSRAKQKLRREAFFALFVFYFFGVFISDFQAVWVIVGNQLIGAVQYRLSRTEVLGQYHLFSLRIVFLKLQNVGNGSPPKFVNGLVVIADNTDVFASFGQKLDQLILGIIGVLILINQNIFELVLVAGKNLRTIP